MVSDVRQSSLNAIVIRGWILAGESHDGINDFLSDARSARFSIVAEVELLGDEFPVPAKECVGRDDGRELMQRLAANGLSLACQ